MKIDTKDAPTKHSSLPTFFLYLKHPVRLAFRRVEIINSFEVQNISLKISNQIKRNKDI